MINEQYERAKRILSKHQKEHNALAEELILKEVIHAEDVERIFGKRPWVSRSEEIMAIEQQTNSTGQSESEEEKEPEEKETMSTSVSSEDKQPKQEDTETSAS